jgi:DHA2 family multidrug resistance protein
LLKDKNFLGGLTIMLILGLANVAIASVLPTMFQHLFGYSTIDTGLLLMPRGLGIMISMFIAKRLMQHMDLRYLMSAGYLICAAALAMMVTWSLEMDSGPILSSGFIQGLGLGLLFTPATMAAFSTLPQQFRPDGSSLLNLVRNIGGSFGISAIFTLISRNSQISHADLSSHITPYSLPGIDPLTAAARLGDTGTAALQLVDLEIQRQASMIAYLDNFYAMAILLLLISILPLLLKPIHLNNRATN